jgi:hypothetical protein
MSKSRGLFDEQIRLEKLSKKRDPSELLSAPIDFEFFRKPLVIKKASKRSTKKTNLDQKEPENCYQKNLIITKLEKPGY